MTIHRVVKHIKASSKKLTGPRVVYLKRDPGLNRTFIVQIFRGDVMTSKKDFITKSAALEWIDLNAKGVELKDLTGDGKVRSHVCPER